MFWPLGHSSPAHNPLKNLHMSDVTLPDMYRLNQKHKTLVIAGWFCPQRCDVVTFGEPEQLLMELQFHRDTILYWFFGTTIRCDGLRSIQDDTICHIYINSDLSEIQNISTLLTYSSFLFLFLGCLWFPACRLLTLFRKGAAHEWKHWHRRIWRMAVI